MPRPILKRVESAGGGDNMHEDGKHIILITSAYENMTDEYIEFTYSVQTKDGDFKEYPWTNTFRRYYSEPSNPQWGNALEKFLTALEDSNPQFSIDDWQRTWNCREFAGLKVGAMFREYLYTGQDGSDRSRPEFSYAFNVARIDEDMAIPKPRDKRAAQVESVPAVEVIATAYDDSLPF